jgi:hypothetical protein
MTKQGIPAALTLAGIDTDAAVSVVRLAVAPAAFHIGDNAELEIALRPDWNRQVTAALSYVIEFARSTGRPSCKFVHAGHDLAGARGAPRTAGHHHCEPYISRTWLQTKGSYRTSNARRGARGHA